jgi:hypothetical protein
LDALIRTRDAAPQFDISDVKWLPIDGVQCMQWTAELLTIFPAPLHR